MEGPSPCDCASSMCILRKIGWGGGGGEGGKGRGREGEGEGKIETRITIVSSSCSSRWLALSLEYHCNSYKHETNTLPLTE